jgi:uncharacterized membrane protein (DUF2068 family)
MAQLQTAPQTATRAESATMLLLIAAFKLVKGVLLFAVGVGALKLLHQDVSETIAHWVNVLRVDPDNRFVHALLTRLLDINQNQLKALSVGTFIYAGLLLTEGTGLLLRKRWAEYFTIITTAGLIPLEIYEISRHLTAAKIVVLLINVAIVVYLVMRVRHARGDSKQQAGEA